jgi:adenylylsulfate kinase
LAHAVEEELYKAGCRTFVFDGDNVRYGLCANLGFSEEDRHENIRRIGEMAKLFTEAGVIALTAFISPYKKDRERVRALVSENDFIEIYCDSPLQVCEERDVKGLYKKARAGVIQNYTGISSPYEPPENPDLHLDTAGNSVEDNTEKVLAFLQERHIFKR